MYKLQSIIYVAASAIVLATGCSEQRAETVKTDKVIPVKTLTVSGSAITSERSYVGTAEESFAVSLSFSGIGTVERVAVSEGQRVSKGQLLAVLNNGTVRTVRRAKLASASPRPIY